MADSMPLGILIITSQDLFPSRMTAVSLRWISRCARHVEVTPIAANSAAEWLARAQQSDGGWAPTTALKNDPRAQAPLPLAAHALLALIQAKVMTTCLHRLNKHSHSER